MQSGSMCCMDSAAQYSQICHCEEAAGRRGNLGKAVTILPGLSCDPAGYCEIATAPSGPRNDTSGGCGGAPAPLRGLIALYRALTERRYRPRRDRFHFNDSLCVSTALRREGHAPPLQWRVRSTMVPGNLQLPMAVTTRKGHAASVRRQSRQRLRSDRRYRRNRCIPLLVARPFRWPLLRLPQTQMPNPGVRSGRILKFVTNFSFFPLDFLPEMGII